MAVFSLYFCFMRTFWPKFILSSSMQTDLDHVHVRSVLWTEKVQIINRIRIVGGNAEKSSIHKCQNLAVLDWTYDLTAYTLPE